MTNQVEENGEIKKLKEQVAWYQAKLDEFHQIFYHEGGLVKVARKLTRIFTRKASK